MSKDLPEADQALVRAVILNDIEGVRQALAQGADIHRGDIAGCTPLYHAGGHAGVEIVELLLGLGADPNVFTQSGLTPLHNAIIATRLDGARALLEGGADINLQQDRKATPLHTAFFRDLWAGTRKRTFFLVAQGADLSRTMFHEGADRTVVQLGQRLIADHPFAETLLEVINAAQDARRLAQGVIDDVRAAETERAFKSLRRSARESKGKYRL